MVIFLARCVPNCFIVPLVKRKFTERVLAFGRKIYHPLLESIGYLPDSVNDIILRRYHRETSFSADALNKACCRWVNDDRFNSEIIGKLFKLLIMLGVCPLLAYFA